MNPGTKKWAIQQMLEGKKVRRTCWYPDVYWEMDDKGDVFDECLHIQELNSENGDDWEFFAHPHMSITFESQDDSAVSSFASREIIRGRPVKRNTEPKAPEQVPGEPCIHCGFDPREHTK